MPLFSLSNAPSPLGKPKPVRFRRSNSRLRYLGHGQRPIRTRTTTQIGPHVSEDCFEGVIFQGSRNALPAGPQKPLPSFLHPGPGHLDAPRGFLLRPNCRLRCCLPVRRPGCRLSLSGGCFLPRLGPFPRSASSILGVPHQRPFLSQTLKPPPPCWPPLPAHGWGVPFPPHSARGPWRPSPRAAGGEGAPAPTLSAIW